MKESQQTNKNLQVEGLRGIGCVFVTVFHLICRYNQIYFPDSPLSQLPIISNFGTVGVGVFFAISFWYMAGNNPKIGSIKALLQELKRRFLKLYCPYVLSVLLTYTFSLFLELGDRKVSFFDFILNLSMFEGFIPTIEYVDGAHWYISALLSMSFFELLVENKLLHLPQAVEKHYKDILYFMLLIGSLVLFYTPIVNIIFACLSLKYIGIVISISCVKRIYLRDFTPLVF